MDRKALGKGISALIPDKETGKEEKVVYLPVDRIKPNPFQPRKDFDQAELEELTQSIKEKGLIQPLVVRRRGDEYELIAGERRLRAAKLLNLNELPVLIKESEDKDALELSLIENIQRQDLNPVEEALAFKYLMDKFEVTQERLSEILGKSRVSIANIMRLLKLPHEVQEEIRQGRISFAHGRALLEIEDANIQRRLLQEVICNSLSVRELENLIKSKRTRLTRRKSSQAQEPEPFLRVLEEELQQVLATKIRIIRKKKRGSIFIEFYSQDDLARIVKLIRGDKAR